MKPEFSTAITTGASAWPVKDWIQLVKLPISLMNAVAVVAGYAVCRPVVDAGLLFNALGVGVLACGSASLNNYQDRNVDADFPRTRRRPLPRQAISSGKALVLSIVLIGCGLTLLLVTQTTPYPATVGAAAVFLYNGLYTKLKHRTILAVIPGALCGMLPPLIGWTGAGGSGPVSHILILMFMLGIWQLPHFWLILLSDARAYRATKLPNMLHFFSKHQLHRLLFIWLLAFGSVVLFLPVIQVVANPWLGGLLVICMVILMTATVHILRTGENIRYPYSFYFNLLNGSMGFVLMMIILDGRL